jgi:hypothetical protein
VSIITILISINEKADSTFAEWTMWNFNQYRSSSFRTSNISKTFNFDSIKEKLMKAEKCFNCDESSHLSKNCSKLRKSRVAEMKMKNENSRKE